jgi:large subunit ribosomal protein L9
MKIILLKDVRTLGKKGEIAEVSDGYANNYVIPQKIGIEANAKNVNDLKLKNANAEKVAAQQLADAESFAEKT